MLSDPRILRGVAPSPGARHLVRADQLSALGIGEHCHREAVDCASCSSRRATAIQGHRRRLREPEAELARLCDAPLRPLDRACMDRAAFMAAVAVVCWRCACGEAFIFLCHCQGRGKDCHTANYEAPVQAGAAFLRARIAGLSPERRARGPSRGDAHALWQHLTGGACEAARDLPLDPAPNTRPPSLARSPSPPSRRGSPSGPSAASPPSPRGPSPRATDSGASSRASAPPRSREAAAAKRASWDIAVPEQSADASHGPRRPPTPGRPRLAHFYAGDERRARRPRALAAVAGRQLRQVPRCRAGRGERDLAGRRPPRRPQRPLEGRHHRHAVQLLDAPHLQLAQRRLAPSPPPGPPRRRPRPRPESFIPARYGQHPAALSLRPPARA